MAESVQIGKNTVVGGSIGSVILALLFLWNAHNAQMNRKQEQIDALKETQAIRIEEAVAEEARVWRQREINRKNAMQDSVAVYNRERTNRMVYSIEEEFTSLYADFHGFKFDVLTRLIELERPASDHAPED